MLNHHDQHIKTNQQHYCCLKFRAVNDIKQTSLPPHLKYKKETHIYWDVINRFLGIDHRLQRRSFCVKGELEKKKKNILARAVRAVHLPKGNRDHGWKDFKISQAPFSNGQKTNFHIYICIILCLQRSGIQEILRANRIFMFPRSALS